MTKYMFIVFDLITKKAQYEKFFDTFEECKQHMIEKVKNINEVYGKNPMTEEVDETLGEITECDYFSTSITFKLMPLSAASNAFVVIIKKVTI